jgi:hypothetical protein
MEVVQEGSHGKQPQKIQPRRETAQAIQQKQEMAQAIQPKRETAQTIQARLGTPRHAAMAEWRWASR